jgi:hypothetical protein
MSIVEMLDNERPFMLRGLLDDVLPRCLDAVEHRGPIGRLRPINDGLGFGNGLKSAYTDFIGR